MSCRDLRRDRTVRGLVVTMRDITERRRLEQELTHRSMHDVLTGLANRASFQDQVYAAAGHARRSGRTVGVLCIDLDEFSAVNDAHGHAVGDGLLIAVGQRLREIVATTGLVARLGGDEFAVLVPDAENAEQAEQIADHLVRRLAEPLAVGDTLVTGSVSIGVATSADATDAGELLKHADLALYVAKGAGKGRWCRYQSELHTAIVQRLELRTALAEAVERNSFAVEYQPIVDLYSGAAVGFEALVALAPPGSWPGPAGAVHRAGRGDRPDRADRRLGTPPGGRRGRPLASAPDTGADAVRQRQRLRPPTARRRPDRPGTLRAGRG